jgi:hypothetical protein
MLGLRAGLPFALMTTLLDARHDWRAGLINAVFFSAIMARLTGRAPAAMGDASLEQVRHAARALRRGSVPRGTGSKPRLMSVSRTTRATPCASA